jgi:hypothetical protein
MSSATAMMLVASAVVGAVGQMKAASAASNAAEYNANLNRERAIQANAQAAEQTKRFRRTSLKRQGALRARGVSTDLLEDNAMQEELEAQSILHGGKVKGAGFSNTANLDSARAKSAKIEGYTGAGSTLLLGGAKAYAAR